MDVKVMQTAAILELYAVKTNYVNYRATKLPWQLLLRLLLNRLLEMMVSIVCGKLDAHKAAASQGHTAKCILTGRSAKRTLIPLLKRVKLALPLIMDLSEEFDMDAPMTKTVAMNTLSVAKTSCVHCPVKR